MQGVELLAKRIGELGIPPWPAQAMFERVLIYRIPDEEAASETYGETQILKPETRVAVDKSRSPRGIIVSAGLRALDIMRSNGMRLGELVWFSPHVPTRFEVAKDDGGQPVEFYFMNVGDVIMSEDVLERLVPDEDGDSELVVTCNRQTGFRHTYLQDGAVSLGNFEPTHSPDEI